jgi:hypothetical protein
MKGRTKSGFGLFDFGFKGPSDISITAPSSDTQNLKGSVRI